MLILCLLRLFRPKLHGFASISGVCNRSSTDLFKDALLSREIDRGEGKREREREREREKSKNAQRPARFELATS